MARQGYDTIFAVEYTGIENVSTYRFSRNIFPSGTTPNGMVHACQFYGDTTHDFFIDKYEVSNRAYSEFVDRGGYQKKEYWKFPFVDGNKTLAWKEAMTLLVNRTDQPGPSGWQAGDFPDGEDDYPVTGISWYEAAAYAEFAGKELPTIHHWESAKGLPYYNSHVINQSNSTRQSLAKVGTFKGINAFGTYDMAENAREWCVNESANKRTIRGGAWNDPSYTYPHLVWIPPLDRSEKNGFRCAKYIQRETIPEWSFAPVSPGHFFDSTFWYRAKTVSDEVFDVVKNAFFYYKKDLEEKIESNDDTHKDWKREKISFTTAYDDKRVILY